MVPVGTVDTWNRDISIPKHRTRALSQDDGLLGGVLDSMPDDFSGMGLPGFPGMPGASSGCPMQ